MSPKLKAALALAGAVAFVALSVMAYASPALPGDVALTHLAQGWRPSALDGVLRSVSLIGYGPVALAITLLVAGGLYVVGRRWDAVFAAATLLADAAGVIVKMVIARPRPETALVQDYDKLLPFSFPSGHATHAFAFYGFLFFVVAALPGSIAWRRGAQVALVLLIALTGLSRVYLDAHWPSDVAGGFLLGALTLGGLLEARRRILSYPKPVED
ncbi:MAG: phosphatase PAP2 family protein [Chloroflexota bacterium]